jgi:cytochrome P450
MPPDRAGAVVGFDAAAGRASAENGVDAVPRPTRAHARPRHLHESVHAAPARRHEGAHSEITQKRLEHAEADSKDGTIELIRDLAVHAAVTVIAEMLGFPPEDYERIKKWSDEMAEALTLNPSRRFRPGRTARARKSGITSTALSRV